MRGAAGAPLQPFIFLHPFPTPSMSPSLPGKPGSTAAPCGWAPRGCTHSRKVRAEQRQHRHRPAQHPGARGRGSRNTSRLPQRLASPRSLQRPPHATAQHASSPHAAEKSRPEPARASRIRLVNGPHPSRSVRSFWCRSCFLAGGTFWCNSSPRFWYQIGVFVNGLCYFLFIYLFLWFPTAHWCTVQWGLVVCHGKEKNMQICYGVTFIFR